MIGLAAVPGMGPMVALNGGGSARDGGIESADCAPVLMGGTLPGGGELRSNGAGAKGDMGGGAAPAGANPLA